MNGQNRLSVPSPNRLVPATSSMIFELAAVCLQEFLKLRCIHNIAPITPLWKSTDVLHMNMVYVKLHCHSPFTLRSAAANTPYKPG